MIPSLSELKSTLDTAIGRRAVPPPVSVPLKQAHQFKAVFFLNRPDIFQAKLSEELLEETVHVSVPNTFKDEEGNPVFPLGQEVQLRSQPSNVLFMFSAYARSVNIPGENVNEIEIPHTYGAWYVAGRPTEDTLSITFVDTMGSILFRAFRAWRRMISDNVNFVCYIPACYKGCIVVAEFAGFVNKDGKPDHKIHTLYVFEGAFPTSVAGYTADVSSDDVVTFDVTFRFDRKLLDKEADKFVKNFVKDLGIGYADLFGL